MERLFKRLLSEKFSKALVISGFLLVGISIILFLYLRPINTKYPIDGSAFEQFGGFLAGAVGSLWALAGVILFYVALKDQRKDFETNRENLELQREELKLNTEELKAQRIEFEKQNETLTLQHETLTHQQFENTFFNLLSMFNELRSNTKKVEKEYDYLQHHNIYHHHTGYEGYSFLEKELRANYQKIIEDHHKVILNGHNLTDEKISSLIYSWGLKDINDIKKVSLSKHAYHKLFLDNHAQLGHYFRSLYHIIKFVSYHEFYELGKNSIKTKDRYAIKIFNESTHRKFKKYTKYVLAQMSTSELLLLFYNGLFFPNIRRWIYHYDLLDNLTKEYLLEPDRDTDLYDGETFNNTKYKELNIKTIKDILKP